MKYAVLILAKDGLWLLGVMAFFQIPKLKSNIVMQVSSYAAIALTVGGIFWLTYRQTIWVPPDPNWTQFPKKCGIEFSPKAWWKNAAGAFGVLLGFLGMWFQIVFAVFAATSDGIAWTILGLIFFALYIIQLVGPLLTFLVRRRCPFCANPMEFLREFKNQKEGWLVCFSCVYRYYPSPMESEAYGGDD